VMPPKAKAKKKPKKTVSEEKKIDPLAGRKLFDVLVPKTPLKTITKMVENGADVNFVQPQSKISSLMKAVFQRNVQHVGLLLNAKANPNYRDWPTLKKDTEDDGKGKGKAKAKAKPKAAPKKKPSDIISDDRLPVKCPDPVIDGMTALHLAVHFGYTEITDRLLLAEVKDENGAVIVGLEKIDVNIPDKKMRTPLWLACAEGECEAVKLLLQAHAELSKDPCGRSCFTIAAIRGHTNVMKILLQRKPNCYEGNDDSQNTCYKSGENASMLCGLNAKSHRSVFDYLPTLKPSVVQLLMTLRHPYKPEELAHYIAKNGGLDCSIAAPPTGHGNRMQDAETLESKNSALMRGVISHFCADVDAAAEIADSVVSLMRGPDAEVRKELQFTNSYNQNVIHLCFGALPVKNYGEGRSGWDQVTQLCKLDYSTTMRRVEKQAREVGYLTAEFLWTKGCDHLKSLKNAEIKARERACLKIAHSLVDAAYLMCPETLDLNDARGLTPLEYAQKFDGIKYHNLFARGQLVGELFASTRPTSAVSSTRASTPHRPNSAKKYTPKDSISKDQDDTFLDA